MCGIAGICRYPSILETDSPLVRGMVQKIAHRGPDAQATEEYSGAVLGHARLSVIDTSAAANQPMSDDSHRYHLVFNGELFNYREWRGRLEAAGVQLHTHSDTEVLLNLLIREGLDCLEHLNGFFAFAFYDSQDQRLWLVRDRFGVKPLWYRSRETTIEFASEARAFSGAEVHCNPAAMQEFLTYTFVAAPRAMDASLNKLLPGQYIEWKNGHARPAFWYQPPLSPGRNESYSSAVNRLTELLDSSVQYRLISDVPLGAFLSGGVDSSIIAALARRHSQDLETFSIGFTSGHYLDESAYSERVAKHIQSRHYVFRLTEEDLLGWIDPMLDALDEPFADSSSVAVYALSHHVRSHVTVALSGDGADELFAGYNRHKALLWSIKQNTLLQLATPFRGLLKAFPTGRGTAMSNAIRQSQRLLQLAYLPFGERYDYLASFTPHDVLSKILPVETLNQKNTRNIDPVDLNTMLKADQDFVLPNDMLTKVDLMSMAHGLEVRTPFLDYRVVEFANSLPFEFKLQKGRSKAILRDAFAGWLPAEVFERRKMGFEVPMERWLRGPLLKKLKHATDKEWLESTGWFRSEGIISAREEFLYKGRGELASLMWSFVVLRHWCDRYSVVH